MALASLGNIPAVGRTLTENFTGPTPLDAIEARRAARAQEELNKFNADSDRLRALAAFKTSNTGAAAEAREQRLADMSQEAQAIIQQSFGQFPEGASDAGMTAWLRNGIRRALPYGNPEVMKWIASMSGTLNATVGTSQPGTGTVAEANIGSQIGYRAAMARAQNIYSDYYSRIPKTQAQPLTDDDRDEAASAYQSNAPKANDWIPFNEMSSNEQRVLAGAAKAIVEQRRAQGNITTVGEVMKELLTGQPAAGTMEQIPPPPGGGGGMETGNGLPAGWE